MNPLSDVITKLEKIIADAGNESFAAGYFAALYLKMTKKVGEGIEKGLFENSERMLELDRRFALRYFDAFNHWKSGQTCSACWQIAFESAKTDSITTLQHLLMGINAHINLDLGIAAAETASGDKIDDLKNDFYRINTIIGDLLGEVQQDLATISWPMRFIDTISGTTDSKIANFSISLARDAAWQVAQDLAKDMSGTYITNVDRRTELLGKKIVNPGLWANLILKPVKWFEKGTVREKIQILLD